jgi:hypothetical protein
MSWTRPLEVLIEVSIALWLLDLFLKPLRSHEFKH